MKFKNLFQKKIYLSSIGDYLTFYDSDTSIHFQMNIQRKGLVDIQVLNYEFKNQNSKLDNSNDFVVVLSFTKHLTNRDDCFERFKNSAIYRDSIFLDDEILDDRWVYRVEKNTGKLFNSLEYITTEIYEYEDGEPYNVVFHSIDGEKYNLLNHTYVSLQDYYSNK